MKNKRSKCIIIILSLVILAAGIILFLLQQTSSLDMHAVRETKRSNYELMPGIVESDIYVTDREKKNMRMHLLKIDDTADVSFKATSKNYYNSNRDADSRREYAKGWNSEKWGYSKVSEQAASYEEATGRYGSVIAGTNGDFFYYSNGDNGKTYGSLVMEGNIVHSTKDEPFFAVMKDGSYKICESDTNLKKISEAVSGEWMVKDGKLVKTERAKDREPRQAIGITKDNEVVIVNVEGRNTSSAGIEVDELAYIMMSQGCTNALNLDGGGSANFLTKRKDDNSLQYRNVPSDGFVRNVSSSLLVVRNDFNNQDDKADIDLISMKDKQTYLKKDKKGVCHYIIEGKKQTGLRMINGKVYCFDKSGDGYTGEQKIGNCDYIFDGGVLTGCSDDAAGKVYQGYCGAEDDGENLVYMYNSGDGILNIDLNSFSDGGEMMDWDTATHVPWYSFRFKIKSVYIGDGIKNIGDYFMYNDSGVFFEGTPTPKPELSEVRIPDSVERIGNGAFCNDSNIRELIMPAALKKIGTKIFSGTAFETLTFSGNKPDDIANEAFSGAEIGQIVVERTSQWEEFINDGGFKKAGYEGDVIFSE